MGKPISGCKIFNSLKDKGCIVIACNCRFVPGVAKGIFRAARDTDSAIIFEIARSESNLEKGYSGMTPAMYAEKMMAVADEVGHDIWALHADHIGIKKGDDADLAATKELVLHQIKAGFTSFAIDASHLYNFEGKNVEEELADNIRCSLEIGRLLKENVPGGDFGLEVEVGEIGRKNNDGMILTTPEEAVGFIKALNAQDLHPQVLAIANGSTHGNIYDENGLPIEQVSINIQRTKDIAQALRDNGLNVRIAQHGITGTPLHLINTDFPKGDIVKGNVATYWQNLAFRVIQIYEPELYKDIRQWVTATYQEKGREKGIKNDEELFGKFGKFAIGHFYDRMHSLGEHVYKAMEDLAYAEAMLFLHVFNSKGSAAIVRQSL